MSTCNSKKFSGGYTPGPPLTGKGRGRKEGKRQGEGGGKEEGKKGERQGEREGRRKKGKKGKARRRGRGRKGKGKEKGREGKGRDDWPPPNEIPGSATACLEYSRLYFNRCSSFWQNSRFQLKTSADDPNDVSYFVTG
jgi:hypothetical protein